LHAATEMSDKWVSTLHRVVLPSFLERRYSMAYFVNINGDALVQALGGGSSKFPLITAKEHLMAKHLASMSEEPDEL
jgi:isopenicillin N synthase-like dioxygenase